MSTPIHWVTRSDLVAERIPTIDEYCGESPIDACGPAANENLRAAIAKRVPSCPNIITIRARDIAAGHFGHGQTLSDLEWDFQTYGYENRVLMWPYKPNLQAYSRDEITRLLWSVWHNDAGGVILELAQAWKLPHNEPGVYKHYVAALGYDRASDSVLIANPDRTPLPHGTGHADWLSVASMANAAVIGMLLVRPAS